MADLRFACKTRPDGPAVDVGVADLEALALVEAVGRLAGGAGGEVDGGAAELLGPVDHGLGERSADAEPASGVVDHDVLDPGPAAGGDAEGDEGGGARGSCRRRRWRGRGRWPAT
jgi:hypothetical protein